MQNVLVPPDERVRTRRRQPRVPRVRETPGASDVGQTKENGIVVIDRDLA
jgi:hypothetical protein